MILTLALREVGLVNQSTDGADPVSPNERKLLVEGEEMAPYTESWNDCKV